MRTKINLRQAMAHVTEQIATDMTFAELVKAYCCCFIRQTEPGFTSKFEPLDLTEFGYSVVDKSKGISVV
jgi:hypothetical protein